MPAAALEYLGYMRVASGRTSGNVSSMLYSCSCTHPRLTFLRHHVQNAALSVLHTQVRIIEELALLNGSTFFTLLGRLGTASRAAGEQRNEGACTSIMLCKCKLVIVWYP